MDRSSSWACGGGVVSAVPCLLHFWNDSKRWQWLRLWVCLISSCEHVIHHLTDNKSLFPGPAEISTCSYGPTACRLRHCVLRLSHIQRAHQKTSRLLLLLLTWLLPTSCGGSPSEVRLFLTQMRDMVLVSLQKLWNFSCKYYQCANY